jgi:hypothetical protein
MSDKTSVLKGVSKDPDTIIQELRNSPNGMRYAAKRVFEAEACCHEWRSAIMLERWRLEAMERAMKQQIEMLNDLKEPFADSISASLQRALDNTKDL